MENIVVREFVLDDVQALLQMSIDNKDHFEKWMPVKPDASYYSLQGQLDKIKSTHERSENDEYYSFGIFLKDSNVLIGNVSLSFVQRGPHQSCMIGYNIANNYTGRGYATKTVSLTLDLAFNKLHFHRVRAEAQPENMGSIRVLEKAGFTREGYSRKSLKVNGEWQDTICMAIIDQDRY